MGFDDDDTPTNARVATGEDAPTAEEAAEDGVPDFKLFASMFDKKGVSSKSIRKGEKDFESHGTNAQDRALEASRTAMEDVLGYTRTHRSDAWVRAWYFPDWWAEERGGANPAGIWLKDRVVVMEHERGNWMNDIGRAISGDKENIGVGRLWLLPEEALYLVERGSIDVWWPDKTLEELLPKGEASSGQFRQAFGMDDYEPGVPLSLEAAYALLIGHDGERGKISLPKYQVYSHLRRAGFHILRATTETHKPEPQTQPSVPLWQWLFSLVSWETSPKQAPFGPLVSPGLYRAYRPIFQQLALLPRHKPLLMAPDDHAPQDPFKVYFHVWKPGGQFSKRNPPPPDFRIAVTDATDSCLPSLEQIEALLESTPLDPPTNPAWQNPGRLHQRLKHGHRNVLVAIVDRGLVNFMRFGEAAFGEEKVFERFDNRNTSRGGKRGGRRGGGRGRGRGRGGRG